MLVNEIITESLDEETLDEFSDTDQAIVKSLKKKGYKYLGSGVDQTAFIEPSTGYVLKIFGTKGRQNFSADHQMFFKWAAFCEKHQNNKFLPRFYGHESFMWQPDEKKVPHRYLMIRTEQLKSSGKQGENIADLARVIDRYPTLSEALAKFEYFYPKTSKSLGKFMKTIGEYYALAETIFELNRMGKKHRWGWDLHGGNIMMRPDGTPVLNDPWVLR